jgi:hypothetical protein
MDLMESVAKDKIPEKSLQSLCAAINQRFGASQGLPLLTFSRKKIKPFTVVTPWK